MKKIFISILALIVAVFALVACVNQETPQEPQDPTPPPTTYEVITTLVNGVTSYKLTIATTTEEQTLNSAYDVEYTDNGYAVEYSYDVFNKIDLTNPQDGFKATKSGTAVVENGEVKESTGDEIDFLPGKLALKFDQANFTDVKDEEGKFSAKISNVNGFIGATQAISDMAVVVEYSSTALTKIVITYATTDTAVTLTYSFS